MDSTLFHIGQLANMMGFAWSGGCWSQYAGEDFRRRDNIWESKYRSNLCLGDGPKKDVRLKITYENFAYTMKNVTFGKSIKQSIPVDQEQQLMNSLDRSYSRVADNDKSTKEHSSEVEIEVRVASTLKNVQRSSWDSKIGVEAGVEYEPPSTTGGVGFSAKANFNYEWGGDEEGTTVNQDWHILRFADSKELPPKTFAEWHAIKKPEKVTIPYTAIIVPTFSVKLEGYMKWGGGYHGATTNFHQDHRGSGNRDNVEHTFGSAQIPFYEDLKNQIEQNMLPWQWHAMKQNYPYATFYIDQLTNKDLYAFTMTGQFEESTENEIKSYWYPSRPIEEMADAIANLTLMADQGEKFPEFPPVRPPPPKVNTIDNTKETQVPPVKLFTDDEGREPEPFTFARIHSSAPKAKAIYDSKEKKPLPVKHFSE